MTLDSSISLVPLVGSYWQSRLKSIGIVTIGDLLEYYPFRYDDFSLFSKINMAQEGETVTIKGKVLSMKNQFTGGGFILQKAVIEDETGSIEAVWFNQRFLVNAIRPDELISLSGKIKRQGRKMQITSPKYEIIRGEKTTHTGRLVPVYSETAGLKSKWLRGRIAWVIEAIKNGILPIEETMDANLIAGNNLIDRKTAIMQIHFPDSLENSEIARRRLAFDELLNLQLEAQIRRQDWMEKTVGQKFEIDAHRDEIEKFIAKLPFKLTNAQLRVIEEIFSDLRRENPMNRLVQGDVGSGKTVVAAISMLLAHHNGFRAVVMAPTEILAQQHYETLQKLFKPLKLKVGIATGSKKDYKNSHFVVGTHALLSDDFKIDKLGLIVIDEQHRFGVDQRNTLEAKGKNPHVLTMTATPIPRTIALTLYGDLELSIIDQMPKDRLPVKTWTVPEFKRADAYEWIKNQKTQTFIICPLIEESETLATVKSAKAEFEKLSKEIFPDLKLGLVHGKLKPKEKDQIISDFKDKKIDILVATPVVEVGIDVPNATIMVIEAADRFGLAQLHQLRGRVGRGSAQSFCLLFSENNSDSPRLKYMEKIYNGLELAETDLKFRGPGQRFGTAQHGKWDLKIADFSDLDLIERANQAAKSFKSSPKSFPILQRKLSNGKIAVLN